MNEFEKAFDAAPDATEFANAFDSAPDAPVDNSPNQSVEPISSQPRNYSLPTDGAVSQTTSDIQSIMDKAPAEGALPSSGQHVPINDRLAHLTGPTAGELADKASTYVNRHLSGPITNAAMETFFHPIRTVTQGGGYITTPPGSEQRSVMDPRGAVNPSFNSVPDPRELSSVGAGEVLARHAIAQIPLLGGGNVLAGGMEAENPNSAASLSNTNAVEQGIGEWKRMIGLEPNAPVSSAILTFGMDQVGQLPLMFLGDAKIAETVDRALIENGGVLSTKSFGDTLLRTIAAHGTGGAVVNSAFAAATPGANILPDLSREGFTEKMGAAAFGGLIGAGGGGASVLGETRVGKFANKVADIAVDKVREIPGKVTVAGIDAYLKLRQKKVQIAPAGTALPLVIAPGDNLSRNFIVQSISDLADKSVEQPAIQSKVPSDKQMVKGALKVPPFVSESIPDGFSPVVIRQRMNKDGSVLSSLIELDVTDPKSPKTTRVDVNTSIKEARNIAKDYPGAMIQNGEVIRAKSDSMLQEYQAGIQKTPEAEVTHFTGGENKTGNDRPNRKQSPVALVAVSDGAKVSVKAVPAASVEIRGNQLGMLRLGDRVISAESEHHHLIVEGYVERFIGDFAQIRKDTGQRVKYPTRMLRRSTPMEDFWNEPSDTQVGLQDKQLGVDTQVNANSGDTRQMNLAPDIMKEHVNRQEVKVKKLKEAGNPLARYTLDKDISVEDFAVMKRIITPEDLVKNFGFDTSRALAEIERLKSDGVIYQTGQDATYATTDLTKTGKVIPGVFNNKANIGPMPGLDLLDRTDVNQVPFGPEITHLKTEEVLNPKNIDETPKPVTNGEKGQSPQGLFVYYRTPEMVKKGIPSQLGIMDMSSVKNGYANVHEYSLDNGATGTVFKMKTTDTSDLNPANYPKTTLQDINRRYPGFAYTVDLATLKKMILRSDQVVQRMNALKTVQPPRNMIESTAQKLKSLWAYTNGWPEDTSFNFHNAAGTQLLRGAGNMKELIPKFIDAARAAEMGPHSQMELDFRPVIDAMRGDRPKALEKFLADHPSVSKDSIKTVLNTMDEIVLVNKQMAAAGLDHIAELEDARQKNLAGEYLAGVYRTFELGGQEHLKLLNRQFDQWVKLGKPNTSIPELMKGVRFFMDRMPGSSPEQIIGAVKDALRIVDDNERADFLNQKGLINADSAKRLKERKVWDTPELMNLKALLGPETSPMIRLAYSLSAANADLYTLQAGNIFRNTPGWWSHGPIGDLTFQVPDEARFGAARGGYMHPDVAAFMDANHMQNRANELANFHNKALAVWKMDVLPLGGMTAFVNNTIRTYKNIGLAAGFDGLMFGPPDFLDAFKSLKALHTDPSIFGPARLAREGMRLGVTGAGLSKMEMGAHQIELRAEIWRAAEKELGLLGTNPSFMDMTAAFAKAAASKGGRSLGVVLELYDMVDQVSKLGSYNQIKRKLMSEGKSPDEAATLAAKRVLRYFPDFKYVPPAIAQARNSPASMLFSPFLTSKANDWRINMNAVQDMSKSMVGQLPEDPHMFGRVLQAAAVTAIAAKTIQMMARTTLSDDEKEFADAHISRQQAMAHPVRMYIGKLDGKAVYCDWSSADDLTMMLRSVDPAHPAKQQVFDYLAGSALDIGNEPMLQSLKIRQNFEVGGFQPPAPNVIEGQNNDIPGKIKTGAEIAAGFGPQVVNRSASILKRTALSDYHPPTTDELPAVLATLKLMGMKCDFAGTDATQTAQAMELGAEGRDVMKDATNIEKPHQELINTSEDAKDAMLKNRLDVLNQRINYVSGDKQ